MTGNPDTCRLRSRSLDLRGVQPPQPMASQECQMASQYRAHEPGHRKSILVRNKYNAAEFAKLTDLMVSRTRPSARISPRDIHR